MLSIKNEEMLPDDFELSTSRFSKFFTPEVNEYLEMRYGKKIEKFDNYIESMMKDAGLKLDELSTWDEDWVDKIMREAERK